MSKDWKEVREPAMWKLGRMVAGKGNSKSRAHLFRGWTTKGFTFQPGEPSEF